MNYEMPKFEIRFTPSGFKEIGGFIEIGIRKLEFVAKTTVSF